jgi:poly [ADP-ribose] polymerase
MEQIRLVNVSDKNNNKYYTLTKVNNDTFKVEYGRVGAKPQIEIYPIYRWNSKYNEKIKKGYIDITNNYSNSSGQFSFNDDNVKEFFNVFSTYVKNIVNNNYLSDTVQGIVISKCKDLIYSLNNLSLSDVNDVLLEIFKLIPRKMQRVNDFLCYDISNINNIIQREIDLLDNLTSNTQFAITENKDFCDYFNIEMMYDFDKSVVDFVNKTNNTRSKIYKVFKITHKETQKNFDEWIDKQDNKTTELLIHGTRNANIFNILKTGLLIRPPSAAYISGNIYGSGVYHSAHTAKSLGYVGYDNDKILLMQNVHLGNYYTYNGWYRDGKDISNSEMNYKDLKKKGYDSLFVKSGDGLLNSEYIVYNAQQTTTQYLVWLS